MALAAARLNVVLSNTLMLFAACCHLSLLSNALVCMSAHCLSDCVYCVMT